jgi:hypothetical protein
MKKNKIQTLSPVLVQNRELHNLPRMSTKMMTPPLHVPMYFTTVITPSWHDSVRHAPAHTLYGTWGETCTSWLHPITCTHSTTATPCHVISGFVNCTCYISLTIQRYLMAMIQLADHGNWEHFLDAVWLMSYTSQSIITFSSRWSYGEIQNGG